MPKASGPEKKASLLPLWSKMWSPDIQPILTPSRFMSLFIIWIMTTFRPDWRLFLAAPALALEQLLQADDDDQYRPYDADRAPCQDIERTQKERETE